MSAQSYPTPWNPRNLTMANDLSLECRTLLLLFLSGDRDRFPLAVNAGNGERPEWNQIDSGHEFGSECWQEFPMPAQQLNQHGGNYDIKHILRRRKSTF